MASVFRASCAIYWIVWLIALAYLLGITVYESNFVVKAPPEYQIPSSIVKVVCYMCVAASVTGCIFVKCDVSHICCFFLYTIPLLIIVPGLCVYGLIKCRDVPELDNAVLLKEATTFWGMKGIGPGWLEILEISRNCCGIYGWKDYQLKIVPVGLPVFPSNPIIKVPQTCCTNSSFHDDKGAKHCLPSNVPYQAPRNDPDNNLFASVSKEQEKIERDAYGDSVFDSTDFPMILKAYEKVIGLQGCGHILNANMQGALDNHTVFFVMLIIFSLLMLLVYVKNWCSGRNFNNGGHSQHSLDVESFSLLEIKPDTADGPNKEERHSLAAEGDVHVEGSQTNFSRRSGAGVRMSRVLQNPKSQIYVPKSVKSKKLSNR